MPRRSAAYPNHGTATHVGITLVSGWKEHGDLIGPAHFWSIPTA